MRVLIVGASGQLGWELIRTAPPGVSIKAPNSSELDITSRIAVEKAVERISPQLIINAAAYTAVDQAEDDPDGAYALNADGPANLARVASEGRRLIHVSTDYVFDGCKDSPYGPLDATRPLGVYGASKLEGERLALGIARQRALVVRTAWLYSTHGNNFVKTMLALMRKRDHLDVVADQRGSPTWAFDLAQAIWRMAFKPKMQGLHHWTNVGDASWYEFALGIRAHAIAEGLLSGNGPAIHPILTAQMPRKAKRPAQVVLDKTATWAELDEPAPHWREALARMMREYADMWRDVEEVAYA